MSEEDFSYGVIGYSSVNIGDEIQSVAAARFVPHIDEYPQRENIKDFVPKSGKKTKLIMNAWWMFSPSKFPPNEKYIDPLLISMYFNVMKRDKFLEKDRREFLLKHGPVGCRDVGTYEWLKENNIPAYFSGCLTLTLQRNYDIPRQDYILCVDVPQNIVDEIKKLTKRPVYSVSVRLLPMYNPDQRMELAKFMLRIYHDAALVVSPRFHVVIPTLALETPVLTLLTKTNLVFDHTRYWGYETFYNSIDIDKDDYMEKIREFDFDNPPKNPDNHLELRNDLIKRCSEFTGYDNPKSLIENEPFPLIKLLELNTFDYSQLKRLLYYTDKKELLEALLNKIEGVTKYDVAGGDIQAKYELKPKFHLYCDYLRYSLLSKILFGKKRNDYKRKKFKTGLLLSASDVVKYL